uniref:Uncharacterized protein n=1 Tax=Ananas comosus var. bracteatus TaxID=296719 RepID=A0A6V7QE68_ANACO|nr:unnamed protein product [Ananas comosus var. bracteatus]
MWWRKKEMEPLPTHYDRLTECAGECEDVAQRIPKGYVPMLVEDEARGEVERVLVHVKLLNEPFMAELLEWSAQLFGYQQDGVLRVPCDARNFRRMVALSRRKLDR